MVIWTTQVAQVVSVHGQCFEGCVLEEQNLSACLPILLLSQSYAAHYLKNGLFRITILFTLSVDQSFCESLYLLNTARMTICSFSVVLALLNIVYLPSGIYICQVPRGGDGLCFIRHWRVPECTGFFKDCFHASPGATGDTQVFSNNVFRH